MVTLTSEQKIAHIAATIREIPDFPKPGILFQDITTLLLDPVAFQYTTDLFVERCKDLKIDVVAGCSSPALSLMLLGVRADHYIVRQGLRLEG
jgi:adenine/guanine phosphoribosyltransferase-like PRPP-binding protein